MRDKKFKSANIDISVLPKPKRSHPIDQKSMYWMAPFDILVYLLLGTIYEKSVYKRNDSLMGKCALKTLLASLFPLPDPAYSFSHLNYQYNE